MWLISTILVGLLSLGTGASLINSSSKVKSEMKDIESMISSEEETDKELLEDFLIDYFNILKSNDYYRMVGLNQEPKSIKEKLMFCDNLSILVNRSDLNLSITDFILYVSKADIISSRTKKLGIKKFQSNEANILFVELVKKHIYLLLQDRITYSTRNSIDNLVSQKTISDSDKEFLSDNSFILSMLDSDNIPLSVKNSIIIAVVKNYLDENYTGIRGFDLLSNIDFMKYTLLSQDISHNLKDQLISRMKAYNIDTSSLLKEVQNSTRSYLFPYFFKDNTRADDLLLSLLKTKYDLSRPSDIFLKPLNKKTDDLTSFKLLVNLFSITYEFLSKETSSSDNVVQNQNSNSLLTRYSFRFSITYLSELIGSQILYAVGISPSQNPKEVEALSSTIIPKDMYKYLTKYIKERLVLLLHKDLAIVIQDIITTVSKSGSWDLIDPLISNHNLLKILYTSDYIDTNIKTLVQSRLDSIHKDILNEKPNLDFDISQDINCPLVFSKE